MHPQPNRRARQLGFTLVEIMVVIVIIGLLATIVAPSVLGMGEDAKIKKATADVKVISDTVKIYILQVGSRDLPTMETLTTPDEKGKTWLDSLSLDPWGKEYEIKPGERSGQFEVVSAGPNGMAGDEDDVSSLRLNEKR